MREEAEMSAYLGAQVMVAVLLAGSKGGKGRLFTKPCADILHASGVLVLVAIFFTRRQYVQISSSKAVGSRCV